VGLDQDTQDSLAAADNSVQYDGSSRDSVTLGGTTSTDGGKTGGTTVTNLAQGDVSANSTDAVNGSQLYATNQNVSDNADNIATNTTNITQNTSDIGDISDTLDGGLTFSGD